MSSKFKLIGSSLMFRFKKKSVIKYTYAQWNKTMIFFPWTKLSMYGGPKPQKDSWFSSSCTLFRIPWVASNWICLGQKSLVQKLRPAVFLDFIIRSGGIRAFFCSQKVLSISWKGCALAREFMVQTVFSGTPFNGFLTQGHLTFFLIWRIGRGCVRAYQNKSEIKWHSLSLSLMPNLYSVAGSVGRKEAYNKK